MVILRAFDLRLAELSEAPQRAASPYLWWGCVATLLITALLMALWRRIPPRPWVGYAAQGLGVVALLGSPWLLIQSNALPELWTLRAWLETFVAILSAIVVFRSARFAPKKPLSFLSAIAAATVLVIAVSERWIGHPLLGMHLRAGLHALALLAIAHTLGENFFAPRSTTTKISAALLFLPLLSRLLLVGDWTALLGVAVPESETLLQLLVWMIAALGLTAWTFPRGPWLRILAPGVASLALVFVLFLHYSQRFGRLQAQFDALSLPLLGAYLPYPQWHSAASSSAFAVSLLFAIALQLRCLSLPSQRGRGLALSLWFIAGIGLGRSSDLVVLLAAAQGLAQSSPAPPRELR